MIGGDDWMLAGVTDLGDIETILRFMRHIWPKAIFEGSVGRGLEPIRLAPLFPARQLAEIFIYRDETSLLTWEEDGLTEENSGAVVFVTVHDDAIAFVFDDRRSAIGEAITHDLALALRENRNVGSLEAA